MVLLIEHDEALRVDKQNDVIDEVMLLESELNNGEYLFSICINNA